MPLPSPSGYMLHRVPMSSLRDACSCHACMQCFPLILVDAQSWPSCMHASGSEHAHPFLTRQHTLHDLPFSPVCQQNSTLVLTAEHRDRNAHEPSGEPETLWGRMQVGRWGGLDQQLWDVVQLCEDAGWG